MGVREGIEVCIIHLRFFLGDRKGASTSGNQRALVVVQRASTSCMSSPVSPAGCRSSSSERTTAPRTRPTCSRSSAARRSAARWNATGSSEQAAVRASPAAVAMARGAGGSCWHDRVIYDAGDRSSSLNSNDATVGLAPRGWTSAQWSIRHI